MRKLCIVLSALTIFFYISSSIMAQAHDMDSPGITKSISANGSAKIWIAPDRARLFLGVQTLDTTIDGAREKNASTMNKIMKELKSLKIKEIFVQSPTYNVTLVEEPEDYALEQVRLPKIIGYKVTQRFTVLLKSDDISTLSKNASLVLDTALQNGVNIIEHDIMFFKEDITQEKEEVLRLAIKDAISRAKVIAETAGMKIKEYSRIDTGFYYGDRYPQFSQVTQVASPVSSEGTASTVIAAKIPVEASVSLNCIIE